MGSTKDRQNHIKKLRSPMWQILKHLDVHKFRYIVVYLKHNTAEKSIWTKPYTHLKVKVNSIGKAGLYSIVDLCKKGLAFKPFEHLLSLNLLPYNFGQ